MKTKVFQGSGDYWDLQKFFQEAWLGQEDVYTDFEGFTDGTPIKNRIDEFKTWIDTMFDEAPGLKEPVKDILIHLLYEEEDQGDYTPSDDYLHGAATMLWYLTTHQFLMCVDQEDK